ncbi:MAG TPA: hypothetical protein VIJ23_07965, partial [Mycobacterium sp.]
MLHPHPAGAAGHGSLSRWARRTAGTPSPVDRTIADRSTGGEPAGGDQAGSALITLVICFCVVSPNP